jgi:hypothetical protein
MRKPTVTTPVYHRDFSESLILKVNAEFQPLSEADGGESGILIPVYRLSPSRRTPATLRSTARLLKTRRVDLGRHGLALD